MKKSYAFTSKFGQNHRFRKISQINCHELVSIMRTDFGANTRSTQATEKKQCCTHSPQNNTIMDSDDHCTIVIDWIQNTTVLLQIIAAVPLNRTLFTEICNGVVSRCLELPETRTDVWGTIEPCRVHWKTQTIHQTTTETFMTVNLTNLPLQ